MAHRELQIVTVGDGPVTNPPPESLPADGYEAHIVVHRDGEVICSIGVGPITPAALTLTEATFLEKYGRPVFGVLRTYMREHLGMEKKAPAM